MYTPTLTPDIRKEQPERKKIKKKMSKTQMQLAIIKKKQCDAKALAIVEQLLDTHVHSEWLLDNLKYINKSHLEDVIEERAIVKLCGYVLCNNSLTVMIKQKYHISAKKNKVYDVSKRKNFCSSRCYGASNFLLEQMLTSPLWLRDKEEIPTFRFLPAKEELERSMPGEEIRVCDVDAILNTDIEKSEDKQNISVDKSSIPYQCGNPDQIDNVTSHNEEQINNTIDDAFLETNNYEVQVAVDKESTCLETSANDAKIAISEIEKQTNENISGKVPIVENNILLPPIQEKQISRSSEATSTILSNDNQTVQNDTQTQKINNSQELKSETVVEEQISEITLKVQETSLKKDKSKHTKHKKDKTKSGCKLEEQSTNTFYNLTLRIEQNVKEWVTEDTLSLLSGEESTKSRLLESVSQHDKYVQLCKKLNKIQLEDEKDSSADLSKNSLKPLPHFSVLQEEGKKMEIKVRAFYKGSVTMEPPNDVVQDNEKDDGSVQLLPLTDAHAPKALRRRIFLDKLHRIMPDLLRALSTNKQSLLITQCTYGSERGTLIKALVNTFSLTASNITFKTAEWTLVGLIFIKMLSIIDPQLKVLLATKQASMYISMILMSYKLDSNYLDRLLIEITNNPKIFNTTV